MANETVQAPRNHDGVTSQLVERQGAGRFSEWGVRWAGHRGVWFLREDAARDAFAAPAKLAGMIAAYAAATKG